MLRDTQPGVRPLRDGVQALKTAEHAADKSAILRRVDAMMDEPAVLDVFRRADGFVVVVHVLATLVVPSHAIQDTVDCIQLAFSVLSKALHRNPANLACFQTHVGYAALADACSALLHHPSTAEHALGSVLSLAMHDAALAHLFLAPVDSPRPSSIRLPHVFEIAWQAIVPALAPGASARDVVLRILAYLTGPLSPHRNIAVLSIVGALSPLFALFSVGRSEKQSPQRMDRRSLARMLERLVEMGASTQDVRKLLQCVVAEDGALDSEMLELISAGAKARWPAHVSLQSSASISVPLSALKSLPASGFTVMMWAWFEATPSMARMLCTISLGAQSAVELGLDSDGLLTFRTSAHRDVAILSKSKVPILQWIHIAVVHHPHRSSKSTIRIFIDGVLTDSLDWPYPRSHDGTVPSKLTLGDITPDDSSSWCIAPSYLLSIPLDDDLVKFVHGLGPQYCGSFQDSTLTRFLTYEASASLSMRLSGPDSGGDAAPLKRVIQGGPLFDEAVILAQIIPQHMQDFSVLDGRHSPHLSQDTHGDVCAIPCQPFDVGLWKVGGIRLALHMIKLARTQHELSRTIAVLCDSLRGCWQNSEDMEKISGYDALANILCSKSHLIDTTSFETLFEFLGLNFRSPDTSTVTNTAAYRSIALDFELWSATTPAIQQTHLEHFSFLLRASRHRRFNARARLSKLSIVRKLIFALQSAWYPPETLSHIVNAIAVVMQGPFPSADVIKPVVSYISAHIVIGQGSDSSHAQINHENAKRLLDMVVSLLRIPAMYARFAESLPLSRVVLLWIGDEPAPPVACQVLSVIGIGLTISPSFGRKLETLGGWGVLRVRLPPIWDDELHRAAIELLLWPMTGGPATARHVQTVRCPQILPVILGALRHGLALVAHNRGLATRVTEQILADLIELCNTRVPVMRLFRSQGVMDALVECLTMLPIVCENAKISAQLTHLGLIIANGSHVSQHQKQRIFSLVKPEARFIASSTLPPRVDPLPKAVGRIDDGRTAIVASARERYRKMVLDARERRRRLSSISERILKAGSERDVWTHLAPERTWFQDETEGPYRMRMKLQPAVETLYQDRHREMSVMDGDGTASPPAQSESSSRDDPDGDDIRTLAEDIVEDKHRRIRHELEPGDVIERVSTVAHISGVDSWPGLLIFGNSHLYMLDGLVENGAGQIIDAVDATDGMFYVAGSIPNLRGRQPARRWSLDHVVGFSNRRFIFRDVALEIFFEDSRTLLIAFLSSAERHGASQRLRAAISHRAAQEHASLFNLVLRELSFALPRNRSSVVASHDKTLAVAQQQWQNRIISNFSYISILNQLSGRTPNDATQYPVFPWVVRDYTSDTLDLSSPESFRDLTKPMGILTEGRRETAECRYQNLESVGEKPFHYGTHFSSSMIVCHFLIRLAPFTNMFKTLQGGDWDLPDRLFSDIARAYSSASQDVRGDVRELIPEFFSFPEFLENSSKLDLGSQSSGEKIDDVKLPPWAKEDPLLFVTLNRRALESHHVSENLPAWIDLIWGCKQRDVGSLNVFHPLSYEGAIDLDKITDPVEREATIGIIHNFGQTPQKLFDSPHPHRHLHGLITLPSHVKNGVCEDALALVRDKRPLKRTLDGPVVRFNIDFTGRVVPVSCGVLSDPTHHGEEVRWNQGPDRGTLQLLYHGAVVQSIEFVHSTCATFADPDTLVTGSTDFTVRIWRVSHGTSSMSPFASAHNLKHRQRREAFLTPAHLLRGHNGAVLCVQASRTWSLVVSGSSDGSAILWDLNRGSYVRTIWHADNALSREAAAVDLVALNESTGYIATCSARYLWLHTVNARPIARLDLSSTSLITSIAFHEREYSHLGILAVGNADGLVALYTWNADGTPKGQKAQWEFVKVRDLDTDPVAGQRPVSVTALRFVGETLWVGDASGMIARWMIPE